MNEYNNPRIGYNKKDNKYGLIVDEDTILFDDVDVSEV